MFAAQASAISGAECKKPAPRNEALTSLFTTLETVHATRLSRKVVYDFICVFTTLIARSSNR